MSAAQQSRAHDSAQIVGVFDAVAQHEEGRFALLFGSGQQVLHRCIFDLTGKGSHALMALGAGHKAQLVGVYPLDGGTGFLRHCGIVSSHSRGHALGQQHRIHAGAALQQLCDRVLAVDEALVPGLVVGLFAAGTAGHIAFFHEVLLPFLSQDAKVLPARRHRIASNEFSGPQRCKAAFCGRH